MTFDQLVIKTMDRLNLSSEAAESRLAERINEAYKDVTSTIGLDVARRVDTVVILQGGVDLSLPEHEVDGMEKVLRIMLLDGSGDQVVRLLPQATYDDITSHKVLSGLPNAWAVKRVGDSTVTVIFDAYPETTAFSVKIEGFENAEELAGEQIPAFPSSFHDVLIEYAMAHELRKMEKDELAALALNRFEKRLSDLRMFIAKSAYLDIYQNQHKRTYSSLLRRDRYGF